MRKMRNSGVEWIGIIPKNWKVARLKRVSDIKTGNTPPKEKGKQNYYSKKGIMWVKTDNLNGINPILDTSEKLNEKGQQIARIAPKGSTLVCCIGTIGKYGIANEDVAYNQQINAVMFNNKYIINKYGTYLIDSSECQHWLYSNGNVLKILNNEGQGKIVIPIPHIKEQENIVNFLDEKVVAIDKVIVKTKETIEDYKKYKQSIITKIVTKGLLTNSKTKTSNIEWVEEIPEKWEIYKTKEFFEFGKGLPITKSDLIDNGEKVISYGQIHSKSNNGTNVNKELFRYISKKYLNSHNQSIVKYNDFIFADTSEDLNGCGNCVYIDKTINVFSGYHTIILRPKYKENVKYLSYLFLTDDWRSQIRSRVSGIKLFSITQKILKETSIILPPKKEREEIVKYLDDKCKEINKIINNKEVLISELERYKKSLIYEYVTGKKEVAKDVNYLAEDISNWILNKNLENRKNGKETVGITNLKLQKLLYYASGIYFLYKKCNLIKEDFVAWKHGPVIKQVYYRYNSNGAKEIQHNRKSKTEIDNETQKILEKMYSKYSKYTAEELRNMTHQERPWKKTSRNKIIEKDLIKDYFENEYKWEQ